MATSWAHWNYFPFDPFLAAHLEKYGNKEKGSISYLSSTIYNKLIAIIGNEVLSTIIEEIRQLNIIQFMSISHSDKLSCISQYILDSQPVERFV